MHPSVDSQLSPKPRGKQQNPSANTESSLLSAHCQNRPTSKKSEEETNPVAQPITRGLIARVQEALWGGSCVLGRASEESETMLHYGPERAEGAGRGGWG